MCGETRCIQTQFTVFLVLFLVSSGLAYAQDGVQRRALISEKISEENVVTLHGDVRPEVHTSKDLGWCPTIFNLNISTSS